MHKSGLKNRTRTTKVNNRSEIDNILLIIEAVFGDGA